MASPFDVHDTIVALSSADGPGARAIVRLSGPAAWACLATCFRTDQGWPDRLQRGRWVGSIALEGIHAPLPAEVLAWRGPRSYTGQDLVELHTLGCPPLVELAVAQLLGGGARAARPGEFTLRAFLAGKLDLTQAEAVHDVIAAGSMDDLRLALQQLAGGVGKPLQRLRNELLGLLAEVEAGLDFAEEDITFLSQAALVGRLQAVRAELLAIQLQLAERGISDRPFRVVLTGLPNAGKSSLFNALLGAPAALVSAEAGTTRDYVSQRVRWGGIDIELTDTAGAEHVSAHSSTITAQAQAARAAQAAEADMLLFCSDCTESATGTVIPADAPAEKVLRVGTKGDLLRDAPPAASILMTSAATGQGLEELKQRIVGRAIAARRDRTTAPSLSRCRQHVSTALSRLDGAVALVQGAEPAELLALELRLALDEVGEMVGAIYTDDLLDRIFSQFCIGK